MGSGKSSSCVMELFYRAIEQKPFQGKRKTRWAILRNHYPELRSTTIKTFSEWLPFIPITYDSPIRAFANFGLPDGTTVEAEFLFIALDRPEDAGKLRGLELTGGWLNEASEMDEGILRMVIQRTGRFPPKKWGGATWTGVVMDTNPPDTDHWWYRYSQLEKPEGFKFFDQPPALIPEGDGYKVNPEAENLKNHSLGGEYYLRQVPGAKKEWIDVFLRGQYGVIVEGKPVYPEYADDLHCRKAEPLPKLPILLGLDYGRTPAAVFGQLTPRGQLRILAELWGEDMGIGTFARDVLKPYIAVNYREFQIVAVGDPAGIAKEGDERSAFDILLEHEIVAVPAHTNALTGRLEAVRKRLTYLVDGQPGFILDPKCNMLRQGFLGKYFYKRISTNSGIMKDTPEKNKYSHVHDALQYLALYAALENINTGSFSKKIEYKSLGIV